jgi:uncharacterized protein
MSLNYHAGQVEVQEEANSRPAADMLAERLAGRSQRSLNFYASADLLVLATPDASGVLRFSALSGQPPLLSPEEDGLLRLPKGAVGLAEGVQAGAIAINLKERRRARANGRILLREKRVYLDAAEEIVNCRKYIAPSVALQPAFHNGPQAREAVDFGDGRLRDALLGAETAFLASISPEGRPDVSHKGGPPGFIAFDPASGVLRWPELIGNGMLKSAGNVRATATASLVALDLASGNAYEFSGRGKYENEMRYAKPRDKGLWPSEVDFPTQGLMTVAVDEVTLLRGFVLPRQRLETDEKVTACSPVEDQVPT